MISDISSAVLEQMFVYVISVLLISGYIQEVSQQI